MIFLGCCEFGVTQVPVMDMASWALINKIAKTHGNRLLSEIFGFRVDSEKLPERKVLFRKKMDLWNPQDLPVIAAVSGRSSVSTHPTQ